MSCGKPVRSEVYTDPTYVYLGSIRGIQWNVPQLDTWQINLLFLSFCVLRSIGRLRMRLISYLPRYPCGEFCPHQSVVFNTSDVGYLGPTSGKTLGKWVPIRAIDGMGPFLRYTTSELWTYNCIVNGDSLQWRVAHIAPMWIPLFRSPMRALHGGRVWRRSSLLIPQPTFSPSSPN